MARQDSIHRLFGVVQFDCAYHGGERVGGKIMRGSENKAPFVAAVSLNDQGYPMHLKPDLVSGFASHAIGNCTKTNLALRT